MTPQRRNGFTLLELLLALTISALVVTVAHRLFTGVVDTAKRMKADRSALDREMNGRRWLMETVGSLDVGSEGSGFSGRPGEMEFSTWQRTPLGWLTRERVRIALSGDALLIESGRQIVVATPVSTLECDYLLDPGAHAKWVREWISPVSAPLAIRLRVGRGGGVDTLLFLVGSRG